MICSIMYKLLFMHYLHCKAWKKIIKRCILAYRHMFCYWLIDLCHILPQKFRCCLSNRWRMGRGCVVVGVVVRGCRCLVELSWNRGIDVRLNLCCRIGRKELRNRHIEIRIVRLRGHSSLGRHIRVLVSICFHCLCNKLYCNKNQNIYV